MNKPSDKKQYRPIEDYKQSAQIINDNNDNDINLFRNKIDELFL